VHGEVACEARAGGELPADRLGALAHADQPVAGGCALEQV
jgi:hypothetical protein